MTQPTTLAEAVKKYGEERVSIFDVDLNHDFIGEAFKAGAAFQREQILALLRSDEAYKYDVSDKQGPWVKMPSDWADWIESQLDGDK